MLLNKEHSLSILHGIVSKYDLINTNINTKGTTISYEEGNHASDRNQRDFFNLKILSY